MDKLKALENVSWDDSLALAEACKSVNWDDPKERRAVALTVLRHVKIDIEKEDLLPLIADVENVPLGQTIQWAVRKGMKAYVHEPGTAAPRSHITQKTLSIQSEMVSVHPEIELGQLKSGRYGSLAEMKTMAKDELLGQRYTVIWNTLRGSIAAGSANYWQMNTTDSLQARKDVLVSGINYCEDQQGGPIKAIIGRRSILGFVTELPGYAETTLSKIDNDGFLGSFRGIPLIAMKQYTDLYGINQIQADTIYIVKSGTIKYAKTQDVEVEEGINVDTLMWSAHYHMRHGTAVFYPEWNARINYS